MTENQFKNLSIGDIISGELSGRSYVVTNNYGNVITAVMSINITRPQDWILRAKADYVKYDKTDE